MVLKTSAETEDVSKVHIGTQGEVVRPNASLFG